MSLSVCLSVWLAGRSDLFCWMSLYVAMKMTVRSMPKDELILFHHGWGTGIRNAFGMWQGNTALLASCAARRGYGSVAFPDDASMVIIEAVWQRLQEER